MKSYLAFYHPMKKHLCHPKKNKTVILQDDDDESFNNIYDCDINYNNTVLQLTTRL